LGFRRGEAVACCCWARVAWSWGFGGGGGMKDVPLTYPKRQGSTPKRQASRTRQAPPPSRPKQAPAFPPFPPAPVSPRSCAASPPGGAAPPPSPRGGTPHWGRVGVWGRGLIGNSSFAGAGGRFCRHASAEQRKNVQALVSARLALGEALVAGVRPLTPTPNHPTPIHHPQTPNPPHPYATACARAFSCMRAR
jgi:hypothetical protein